MSDELRELCPFCGGEPIVEKKGNSIAHWIVRCTGCRALVKGTTEAQAIDGWNRRVPQPAAESELMLDMLDTLKMAYRKHHLGDDTIGWEELDDTLLNVLCESMGDREFQAWLQRQRPQPAAQEE